MQLANNKMLNKREEKDQRDLNDQNVLSLFLRDCR